MNEKKSFDIGNFVSEHPLVTVICASILGTTLRSGFSMFTDIASIIRTGKDPRVATRTITGPNGSRTILTGSYATEAQEEEKDEEDNTDEGNNADEEEAE